MSFLGAVGWALSLSLLFDVAVQITEESRPGAASDLVSLTACHMLAHFGVLFVVVRFYAPEASLRDTLGLRKAAPWSVLLAAAAGAGMYPAMNVLDDLVARRLPLSSEELETLAKVMAIDGTPRRVFLAVSLAVLMPLGEELFFRGAMFGALKRGRRLAPVVLFTAATFALARGDVRSVGSTLTLGLLLGWLRGRAGSSLPSLAAHVAFYAVPVARLLASGDPLADDVYPRAWMLGGSALAVISAALLHFGLARSPAAIEAQHRDE